MADLKVAPVRSVEASDALTPWSEEHAAMVTTTERMLRMNMAVMEGRSEGVMRREMRIVKYVEGSVD